MHSSFIYVKLAWQQIALVEPGENGFVMLVGVWLVAMRLLQDAHGVELVVLHQVQDGGPLDLPHEFGPDILQGADRGESPDSRISVSLRNGTDIALVML